MKRILIGLVIGLILLEVGRRLYHPADNTAAAAVDAYRAGDYATAETRFHQAEQSAPDPAVAAHNHAASLYKLRRFEDADGRYQHSADDEALHTARADYDRGNCAFNEACREEGTADADLLEQAAKHYETCLAREGSTSVAGSLFDDARHNLELTKLILAESAETKSPNNNGDDPPEPKESQAAKDDPFAPANAAHPPEDQAGQKKNGEKPSEKSSETKSQSAPNAEPPQQQTRECKECKRGGCPKCKKKLGKGPGPLQSQYKSDGPKPNPGKADNGKSPGKGKSPQEVEHSDPGSGKKGKPGEGGKPNPNGNNGVGDAQESGTGPADPSAKSTKKNKPSDGKMVGPDGVTYERQDKPSRGTTGSGGEGATEDTKQPQAGGKDGTSNGAAGDSDKTQEPKEPPPTPAELEKLFRNGASRPNDSKGSGSGGPSSGQTRSGSGKYGIEADDVAGNGDPREQAAARRLRQAVQRIQNARDGRQPPPGAGPRESPNSDRRRDW
jgi:hypothetical protein